MMIVGLKIERAVLYVRKNSSEKTVSDWLEMGFVWERKRRSEADRFFLFNRVCVTMVNDKLILFGVSLLANRSPTHTHASII